MAILSSFAAAAASAQTSETPARGRWGGSAAAPAPSSEPISREILLGTITTRSSESGTGPGVADQILADGLDALHRGDVMLGRRRLEAVIEAYPDSAAAVAARAELDVLYNFRARSTPMHSAERPAHWVPAQGAATRGSTADEVRSVGSAAPDARVTYTKEAQARDRQTRRDERWLRALSFDFQMSAGDRVFFAESSADIGARARGVLTAQALWLARHPELNVVVEAHADDNTGSRDGDMQISERRARAVQARLVEEGLEASRITIVAFGRDRPVAICQASECAAQNRRVITRIGGLPDADFERRGTEEPALAVVPSRTSPGRRD